MKSGIELIAQERKEQIEKHGRTVELDAIHNHSDQLITGVKALINIDFPDDIIEGRSIGEFPFDWDTGICVKMANKPLIERLTIAGAFLAAEIDRLKFINQTDGTSDAG